MLLNWGAAPAAGRGTCKFRRLRNAPPALGRDLGQDSVDGIASCPRAPQAENATRDGASSLMVAACLRGVVRKGGLEPPRLAALEPKSSASTSSATFAMQARAVREFCAGIQQKKKHLAGPGAFRFGGPSRIRTLDLLIKSQLLYQLS
jgi:hypothetical protein